MASRKKYLVYQCRDCDTDFLLADHTRKRICCPMCGDGLFVELVRSLWTEIGVIYKKRWTPDEDAIIFSGKKLGYTNRLIAESLEGRTGKAVHGRWCTIQKNKISGGRLNERNV